MKRLQIGTLWAWCKRNYVIYIVIIVLSLMETGLGAATYRLPEYKDTPDNFTYYRGDRAILQCAVRFLGTKQVIWKKADNDHVLTYGEFIYVADKTYSVVHLPHRDEWNLVISNVQPRHAGLYECQINTKEDLRKYVQLNVRDESAPSSEAIQISGSSYVEKGDKIVLTCNATGDIYPPEDVDWFKDGRKIKESDHRGVSISKFRLQTTKTLHSVLEIEHSEMEDSGNYICRSSELSITDKNVMVLNGSASRSRKNNLRSEAETNPSKRENNDSSAEARDASMSVSTAVHSNKLVCLLTFIVYILSLNNAVRRHL